MQSFPDCQLFAIGPLTSVNYYLRNTENKFKKSLMQGGFVGYHLHAPAKRLEKFEGMNTVPTFNLNGDVKGAEALLSAQIERSFVGKNVCHTIVYDRNVHEKALEIKPQNRAMEIFHETMGMYLDNHGEKKFHDPPAAVCMLHPEIGTWYEGRLIRAQGGWGAIPGGTDKFLVDIDRDKLWSFIFNGK